jgi:aminoacylase
VIYFARKYSDLLIYPFLTFALSFNVKEVGGGGMAAFLDSELYRSLPGIALALDEGLANPADTFSVFYGERLPWWVDVTATGPTGHGSRFIDHTAVEQLISIANRALEFRQGQKSLLGMQAHENCTHAIVAANQKRNRTTTTLGDVTSLNITTLQAGVQVGDTYAYNCVPPVAKCSFDIRISPHTEPSEISNMLDQWCIECSSSASNETSDDNNASKRTLSWNYIGGHGNDLQKHALTSTNSKENPWYTIFEDAIKSMGIQIEAQVFPAATDSRFLRALGIRAFGFSPMRNTEILLHENDEYIPESTFIEGISVYVTLIKALGLQGKEIDEQTK